MPVDRCPQSQSHRQNMARWALGEACQIVAEDAQLLAAKLELGGGLNLTAAEALRLFATMTMRSAAGIRPPDWDFDASARGEWQ